MERELKDAKRYLPQRKDKNKQEAAIRREEKEKKKS